MGALLGAVPAGALGDRFGVRSVVAVGALAMAAALALRAVASSLTTLLAAMVLYGVTLATVATNLPKAIGLWFPAASSGSRTGSRSAERRRAGAGDVPRAAAARVHRRLARAHLRDRVAVARSRSSGSRPCAIRCRVARRPVGCARPARRCSPGCASSRIRESGCSRELLLLPRGYIGVVGYLPTYLVTVQGFEPAAGAMLSSCSPPTCRQPDPAGVLGPHRLRRQVYVPGVVVCGIMIIASSLLVGRALLAARALGLRGGGIALVFAVPLELERVGPALAGAAVGATLGPASSAASSRR